MVIPWALMETGFISKQKVYRDTHRDGGIIIEVAKGTCVQLSALFVGTLRDRYCYFLFVGALLSL